jgi:hypothetical protein
MNRRKYPRAALSALALCLLAAAAMLVSPAAKGQKGDRVAEELSQALESYESVTLDPVEVRRAASAEGSVKLRTARGDFDLEVEPFDVRTDDYRAVAAGADGVMTELPRTPSNSFRGRVRGQEGTFVRLYLDGQKVQGLIITPSETFFVEPARDLAPSAGGKEFVFYSASDVKPSGGECVERSLGGKVEAEAARTKVAPSASAAAGPSADDAFAPKPETEIATEADFEFYRDFNASSATATNNDILNIMTQVDGIYDAQLGIKIRVVFQRVWTTDTDPYTTANASDALDQLTAGYNGSFGGSGAPARDLVHLFTGKTLLDDNGNTGIIGIAWTGALCDLPAYSYGLSQSRFASAADSRRVVLTAHEVGHNFGASHTNPASAPAAPNCDSSVGPGTSPTATIMSRNVQSNAVFCQYSRDQITSHVTGTGGSCLTRLAPAGCNYTLDASSQFFPASGGTNSVNITSNCAWGVAEGVDWVTPAVSAGSGSANIPYTVGANTNTGPRETFVEIGGQKLSVKQAASPTCGGTLLGFGQSVGGALADTDCRSGQPGHADAPADIYTFAARAGQRVRVEMLAAVKASDYDNLPPGSTLPDAALDTVLYLYGPDGSVVAVNDDRSFDPNPHNTDSAIPVAGFLTLPATGVYTVVATSFEDFDNGAYTVKLSDNSAATTVSFSSATYSVNEGTGGGLGTDGNGFRVITVTRTGTAAEINSGTATVNYGTSDGTASRQKDYGLALGTLVFAPGETTKTFTVFVSDDNFAEGPETVSLSLWNAVGATLGATPAATLTINSNDAASTLSPVRADNFSAPFFVRQQYLDFLNREPDASGFQFWQDNFTQCGGDPQCLEVKRVNVSAAFFLSIEFQETGYLVYRTYKAAYGDATSPNVDGTVPVVRLEEFLPDTQRIGQNVAVNVGDWQGQLEANKQAYMTEFVLRERFLQSFPLSLTPAQFVDKLNQNAGGVLTAAERDALVAQLGANPNVAAGRAAALRAVAENAQLRANEFRRAFVLMQYYGYLRRNPNDPQDVDFRGWKFWLDKLNQFNGDFAAAEMVKAFLSADEYVDRFGTRP